MFSATIEKALAVALGAHEGQRRKASGDPYVIHPLHVALMLARWGQDEDVIVAGLLHDVVEDCEDWDLARLEAEFGRHIARIVAELTEDKSRSWEERKRAGIEKVARMSPQAATAKAADKFHNLHSLALALRACTNPDDVWSRFRRDRETTLALSHELVEALCTRVEPKIARSLRTALKAAVDADADAFRRAAAAAAS